MMTPEQKSDVSRRAAAQRLSLGDYMRRQALQALGDDELLEALVAELAASTERASLVLDRTLARLDESERRMPEIEAAARERAAAEFSALDPQLFAQLLQPELAV